MPLCGEVRRKIADVKEAFGVECYWSLAGWFCLESGADRIALRPTEGGIWDKLSTTAKAILDERAAASERRPA